MTIKDLKKRALEEGAAWLEGDGWGALVEPGDAPPWSATVAAQDPTGAPDVARAGLLERLAGSALYYAYHRGEFGAHIPDPLFVAATTVAQALERFGARVIERGKWETEVPEGAVA